MNKQLQSIVVEPLPVPFCSLYRLLNSPNCNYHSDMWEQNGGRWQSSPCMQGVVGICSVSVGPVISVWLAIMGWRCSLRDPPLCLSVLPVRAHAGPVPATDAVLFAGTTQPLTRSQESVNTCPTMRYIHNSRLSEDPKAAIST